MFDCDGLPCILCVGEPVLVQVIGAGWRVICENCHHKTGFHPTEDGAVDAWNGGPSYREMFEAQRLESR